MNCVNYNSLTKYLDLKDDELNLTVKKKSGKIEEVTLSKTTIQNEDNIISSFVFEAENKVGYINLPSFYTDFYSYDAKGCANDIAKEILKLKQVYDKHCDLIRQESGELRKRLKDLNQGMKDVQVCIDTVQKSKDDRCREIENFVENLQTKLNGQLKTKLLNLVNQKSIMTAEIEYLDSFH